ncbi:MAG: glycosyltransferase family 4 protein [Candidatus Hydrogenedentes bacterium]|nr:glycosyltransferase family 4 protein [Candidatus Hydrogenedentota bacterium]
MKLALLMGNRYNPWHLQPFRLLRGNPHITAFRAESQIQDHFKERGDGTDGLDIERIYFNTQRGNPVARMKHLIRERYFNTNPRLLPFHERLHGYDVAHSWELFTDWSAEALVARERFGVPLVITVWDLLPFNMERESGRREIKQRVAKGADRFVVYTDRSYRTLRFEDVDMKRVVKILPGVDTSVFSPGPSARAQLGLSDDDFVILYVGWFVPRKGIDFLLYAMRELVDDPAMRGRKPVLVMVGSGYGQERVKNLVSRLKLDENCRFTGALTYDRMPDMFRSADVFAFPSIASDEWQEQFGMSLIEAMACGRPVVTTLSGAIEEIAGDAAVLVQPNDFLALYQSIRTLAMDSALREDLGAHARARAVELFDVRKHAEALSNVYDEVMRPRAG